jgi:hypothetical protein
MNTHPTITAAIEREQAADRRRDGRRSRLVREARRARASEATLESISVRRAVASDGPAIAQIAELESKPVPAGQPVVALRDGRLAAVLDPDTGAVLADPFLPTARAVRAARAYIDACAAAA